MGLIPRKYDVIKADGTPVDGDYFVLRPGRDAHAAIALKAYADSVKADNPELAADLYRWLDNLEMLAPLSEGSFPP